jgi:hypothetical protein
MIYHQIDLYFHVPQTDPEAPWWWQTTAETCRSQYIEWGSGASLCIVLVIYTKMYVYKQVGLPWRRRQQNIPKRWQQITREHVLIFQKTATFILSSVKTSNLKHLDW